MIGSGSFLRSRWADRPSMIKRLPEPIRRSLGRVRIISFRLESASAQALIRCNSETDSKVWMVEEIIIVINKILFCLI